MRPMPVTILGTHRSGTSMLCRLLNLCGVYLGNESDLLMERPGNPKGCWEHLVFAEFNTKILNHLGGTLEDPPVFAANWLEDPEIRSIREDAAAFVEETFGARQDWGWKDPQTTITLPFWRQIVPNLRAVISVRNPLDVAASVRIHDGQRATERKALALWQYYTEAALRHTTPADRFIVFYEDFFANPRQALEPVLAFLDLPPIAPGSAREAEIESFIDPSLKHHGHTFNDVVASPDVFTSTKLLYDALLHHPATIETLFAFPALAEHTLRAWGGDASEALQAQSEYIGRMARDIQWQGTHIGELHHWVEHQRHGLDWLGERNAQLERELDELRQWAEQQRAALDWHGEHRTQLERELEELRARTTELEAELAELRARAGKRPFATWPR
jgi:hypothetical protein